MLGRAGRHPSAFVENGSVVGAPQAEWSAITHTQVPAYMGRRHLQHALATAIGIGHDTDTDTVAAELVEMATLAVSRGLVK